jgi:hypothetical protein
VTPNNHGANPLIDQMRNVAVLSIIQSWPTAKISKKEIAATLPLVRSRAHNPSATLAKKSK